MRNNSRKNRLKNVNRPYSSKSPENTIKGMPKHKNENKEYEAFFLANHFPSSRNGKVVYIRTEYHERLQRIVQLTKEEKMTLYAYIDNILEHHFREFGGEITDYFNDKFKPIL